MFAPMITFASARRARRYVLNSAAVRREKVALRRLARHRDKAALARGDYEAPASRGQNDRDVV